MATSTPTPPTTTIPAAAPPAAADGSGVQFLRRGFLYKAVFPATGPLGINLMRVPRARALMMGAEAAAPAGGGPQVDQASDLVQITSFIKSADGGILAAERSRVIKPGDLLVGVKGVR